MYILRAPPLRGGGGRLRRQLRPPQRPAGRAATALLAAGAVAHTFLIGMERMQIGYMPFVGTTSAISVFVWLLALAYLYTEMSTNERAMGVFITPLLVR